MVCLHGIPQFCIKQQKSVILQFWGQQGRGGLSSWPACDHLLAVYSHDLSSGYKKKERSFLLCLFSPKDISVSVSQLLRSWSWWTSGHCSIDCTLWLYRDRGRTEKAFHQLSLRGHHGQLLNITLSDSSHDCWWWRPQPCDSCCVSAVEYLPKTHIWKGVLSRSVVLGKPRNPGLVGHLPSWPWRLLWNTSLFLAWDTVIMIGATCIRAPWATCSWARSCSIVTYINLFLLGKYVVSGISL